MHDNGQRVPPIGRVPATAALDALDAMAVISKEHDWLASRKSPQTRRACPPQRAPPSSPAARSVQADRVAVVAVGRPSPFAPEYFRGGAGAGAPLNRRCPKSGTAKGPTITRPSTEAGRAAELRAPGPTSRYFRPRRSVRPAQFPPVITVQAGDHYGAIHLLRLARARPPSPAKSLSS